MEVIKEHKGMKIEFFGGAYHIVDNHGTVWARYKTLSGAEKRFKTILIQSGLY